MCGNSSCLIIMAWRGTIQVGCRPYLQIFSYFNNPQPSQQQWYTCIFLYFTEINDISIFFSGYKIPVIENLGATLVSHFIKVNWINWCNRKFCIKYQNNTLYKYCILQLDFSLGINITYTPVKNVMQINLFLYYFKQTNYEYFTLQKYCFRILPS